MKKYLYLCPLLLLIGCGGGNNNQSGSTPQTTQLVGNWTVVASSPEGNATLTANLVPSACTVMQSNITFEIGGDGINACVLADNLSGQGSVIGTGSFLYPPQGMLFGASANPAPLSGQMQFLFAEADAFGNIAAFQGIATNTTSNTITGTYTCDAQTPVCI
jgi:hypothetical protein